jgi:serine/threonine-protein kinase
LPNWSVLQETTKIYPGYIPALQTDAVILRWFALVVGYGIFIPNTWRRATLIVGLLVATAVGFNVCFALVDLDRHVFWDHLISQWGFWMAIAAVLAVYGSHKISELRRQAFQARRLGQYQLKQRLGAGGMGEVYLAEHVLLRRPCALKLIRPERADNPTDLARFEREVRTTATLTHPNVVQIFDYGHADDGTFYYAMEYLPGFSLEHFVNHYGPLPAGRVVHYLLQVCGALREAHSAGLIHRDVKPGNIIVCCRGGLHDVAKILDFGLVSVRGGIEGGEKLTQEGAIAGTPAYMSPEQASGREDLDARSDIYSLGCVAYFLLTGRPPFADRPAAHVVAAHIYEPPAPPTALRPDVPAEVESIVLRCLAKAPSERYPRVQDLVDALSHCRAAAQWTQAEAASWWQDRVGFEGPSHERGNRYGA